MMKTTVASKSGVFMPSKAFTKKQNDLFLKTSEYKKQIPYILLYALYFILFTLLSILVYPLFAQSPGNVSSNLQLWLKADAGVTGATPVTAWADQNDNGFDATVGTGHDLVSNQLNFNPTLDFNDSNEYLQITNGILGSALYTDAWVYVVSRTDNSGNTNTLFNPT